MNILTAYIRKSDETASRIVDNEAVVVTPQEGTARILNEVGARIWELSDGARTIEEIIRIVTSEYDGSYQEVKEDSVHFIRELEEKRMVTLSNESVMQNA